MDTRIERQHDDRGGRYTLLSSEDAIGELDYRDVGQRRIFTHTGVRSRYEGQGLAARLVEQGLLDAEAEGREIVPQCPYVGHHMRRTGRTG